MLEGEGATWYLKIGSAVIRGRARGSIRGTDRGASGGRRLSASRIRLAFDWSNRTGSSGRFAIEVKEKAPLVHRKVS